MEGSWSRNILGATIAVAILTACSAGGGGVPSATSSLETVQNAFGREHYSIALSGIYTGNSTIR